MFFSAQLPPETEEPQFGGGFEEEEGNETDLERFMQACAHPPDLDMFRDSNPVIDYAEDLRELRLFLNSLSS